MAGDWIKVECATPDKPEVYRMAEMLGIAPEHVVGCLIQLWVWADQQTTDGNAPGINAVLIDRKTGVQGFAGAMQETGWLEEDEEGLRFPGFDRHNGKSAKSRAATAKRVAQHKAKKREGNGSGNGEVTQKVTPEKRGCIPRPVRKQIYERDGRCCLYCGRAEGEYSIGETSDDGRLAIDHVIPLSKGGADTPENMVTACCACNSFKSDRAPDECGLPWPTNESGEKMGVTESVTSALPREEKRRGNTPLTPQDKKPPKSDPTPYQEITEAYNRLCPSLKTCRALNDKRKRRMRKLWQSMMPTLEHWEAYFADCEATDAYAGRFPPRPPYDEPFKADLDFLLRDETVTKVLER